MPIVFLVDVSGSMLPDGKIQSLNTAVEESIPHLRRAFLELPDLEAGVRVLSFATEVDWAVRDAVPIETFRWPTLDAHEEGLTETGAAIDSVIDVLDAEAGASGVPPGLVLVSDGMPTDTVEPSFAEAVERLSTTPSVASATRLAVGIGDDADVESLQRFTSSAAPDPIRASDPQQLMVAMRNAVNSLARSATQMNDGGVQRDP